MFGDRLRELRIEKKLSQKELGDLLSLSPNAIYNWEVGRSQPSVEAITKLAEYFNVTTDYLLCFTQDDLNKIERLKMALKEAGMLNGNDDMTEEDFEKAMAIVQTLKQYKNKND